MSKTPTKNWNLWSNARISLTYISAWKQFDIYVEIARQLKAGTFDPTSRIQKHNIMKILDGARSDVYSAQSKLKQRIKLCKQRGETYDFPPIKEMKWKRELVKPAPKVKTSKELQEDEDFVQDMLNMLEES